MANSSSDCVAVSDLGVGARSYGQNPVVGVQLVTGVGCDIEDEVHGTPSVVFPTPSQGHQDCNTTQALRLIISHNPSPTVAFWR